MLNEPEKILRGTKGTIAERPLPQLFQAIWATRRTCGLELKRQAFEKVVVFEAGTPVDCTSNLVHETLGRYLVEKKVLDEEQHMKLLAEAASREVKLERVLLDHKVLDAAALEKHLHANLAQKILDAFRWTEARYRILGDVEIPQDAPRMNLPQLLLTALSTTLPAEQVEAQFRLEETQRFARVHRPPFKLEELKLNARDQRLADALAHRPTVGELISFTELEPEGLARRLYAFSLLGLADLAERVPETPPPEPEPAVAAPAPTPAVEPAPAPRSRVGWIVGAVGATAAAGAIAAMLLRSEPTPPAPMPPPVVPARAERIKPRGVAPAPMLALVAAPEGAIPQPSRPRGLELSASGIVLTPPPAPNKPLAPAFTLAARQLKLGKPALALPWYELGIRKAPQSPEPLYGAALSLYVMGRDAEALERAGRALEKSPEHAQSLLLAGFLDLQAGRVEPARQRLEGYLKAAPKGPWSAQVSVLLEQIPAEGTAMFPPEEPEK